MTWVTSAKASLALVVAFLANFAIVAVAEAFLGRAFPPPHGTDLHDHVQLAAFVKSLPPMAFIGLLLGWTTGALLASASAYLIADRMVWLARAGAAISLIGIASTICMLHHPLWVVGIGLLMPFAVAWLVPRLIGLPPRPLAT